MPLMQPPNLFANNPGFAPLPPLNLNPIGAPPAPAPFPLGGSGFVPGVGGGGMGPLGTPLFGTPSGGGGGGGAPAMPTTIQEIINALFSPGGNGQDGAAGFGGGNGQGFGPGDRVGRDIVADFMGLFGGSPEFTGAPPGPFGSGFPQGSANAAGGPAGYGDAPAQASSANAAQGPANYGPSWSDGVLSFNPQSPATFGLGWGGGTPGGWGNGMPSFSIDPRSGEVSIDVNVDAPSATI